MPKKETFDEKKPKKPSKDGQCIKHKKQTTFFGSDIDIIFEEMKE